MRFEDRSSAVNRPFPTNFEDAQCLPKTLLINSLRRWQRRSGPPPLLEFKDVNTYYGELHVLKGVDYRAKARSSACSAAMPAENPRP